jgi:hypothetical protein
MSLKNLINLRAVVYIILIVLLSIGIWLWIYGDQVLWNDFGLNFLTEVLGAIITILIVDSLIRKYEDDKSIAKKIIAYEDIQMFVNRYISFWKNMLDQSFLDDYPKTLEDFFKVEKLLKIYDNLWLESSPNVFPKTNWWGNINREVKDLEGKGADILDRYIDIVDPEIISKIYTLVHSTSFSGFQHLSSLKNYDVTHNIPRPEILKHYIPPIEENECREILSLHNWCKEQFDLYKKHDFSMNSSPFIFNIPSNLNNVPLCKIEDVKLKEQEDRWDDFVKS